MINLLNINYLAYELISNPTIIMVDEPTTGMDSFTSLVIIKYLAELAKNGKTIGINKYIYIIII